MPYELIIQINPEHEKTEVFAIKHWGGAYGYSSNSMVSYQGTLNIWEKLGGNRDVWRILPNKNFERGAKLCLKRPHNLSCYFFKILLNDDLSVKSGYTLTLDEEEKKDITEKDLIKVLEVVTEINSLSESSSQQAIQLKS